MRKTLILIISWMVFLPGFAQQTDSLTVEEQLALLESEMDSMSLFMLFDSVLNAPTLKSEIGIRFGYASSRLTAGRDFSTQQQGYTPGISYFHKSGIYLDAGAYFDVNESIYNQGILHLGYMWAPNEKWTINPYVERVFPHAKADDVARTATGIGLSFENKWIEPGLDYGALWQEGDISHRLIPSLNKMIRLGNWGFLKNINVYPSFAVMMGNTSVFTYRFTTNEVENYLVRIQQLSNEEINRLVQTGQITTQQAIKIRFTQRYLSSLEDDEIEELVEVINPLDEDNTFQALSYNFSLPLSFQINKTSFMIGYSYAIPIQLPGESLTLDPSGFVSFSINQRITW